MSKNVSRKAYLVGSGIASLASAAHLMEDGGVAGVDIRIFEELDVLGGSLDGSGSPEKGYVMRGGRMLNFTYVCTYELLSFIPSILDPTRSVREEIVDFNDQVKTSSKARLVRNKNPVDVTTMGFSNRDRLDLTKIAMQTEASLGARRIQDCFAPEFFETNFWYMWATMFAFQPWHSAVEFRRYLHRFIHEFPRINTLAGVDRTPYNQYDSIVLPLTRWLENQGVTFNRGCSVTDVDFEISGTKKTAKRIYYREGGSDRTIDLKPDDLLFITNGSMTAASSLGSMKSAPVMNTKKPVDWLLWENLAKKDRSFGNPQAFDEKIGESYWESFTVTSQDHTFFDLMGNFSGNAPGTGALVTLVDSNWLMSVVLAYQPHFINQPKNVTVFWGYGLFPDKPGNFVNKKMMDCNGEEILTELCSHLGFEKELSAVIKSSNCIPCNMPYITSQFLVRESGDRPAVIPPGATNFAFVSQFCEVPEDVVFTVEYSVRAAATAVYGLCKVDKVPPPMYKGEHHIDVIVNAIKTALK